MKNNPWTIWKPRLRKALVFAATIVIPVILGNSSMFNAIWDVVFPPMGYYGGMTIPIVSVSSKEEVAKSEKVLLLLQHAKGSQETLDVLSRVTPSIIDAGSNVQPPLRTIGVDEAAAGSSCFLRVDLPPSTLLAVSVSNNSQAPLRERDFLYSRHDGIRKQFRGDLIVKTTNEDREQNIFWLGFALALSCIGHALGRWRPHSLPVSGQRGLGNHSRRNNNR
jgi:hypothetical protein